MLTIAYLVPEVPIHHAPRLRKYARIEFVHLTQRASRLVEGQIKPHLWRRPRSASSDPVPCPIDFAEVDRKESCANERLRKLFGGNGWAVDIGLWFTHAKEDNWCAPEPGGFKNWQIDGSNRARSRLRRSLSNVWFRPQKRLNLSGGQQCQLRFPRP